MSKSSKRKLKDLDKSMEKIESFKETFLECSEFLDSLKEKFKKERDKEADKIGRKK